MMNSLIKEVKIEVKWDELVNEIVSPFFTFAQFDDRPMKKTRTYQLSVFVQGNLDCACPLGELKHELVFLTVHDVGTNPQNSFVKFINSPPMADLSKNSVFLHICVPGQESGANNFHGNFPSMDSLAKMLPQVLEHFGLTRCIAMGEGAGADVVCRFAMENPDSVAGVVLIHCTSTTHGILENLREIFANLRIEEGKMSETAWDYLMAHKLGEKCSEELRKQFIQQIHQQSLNEHNLSKYLYAFGNREDFTELLEIQSSKFDTILVTGGKSPHNKNIFHMFDHMDKDKTGLMVAEGIVDILAEAPEFLCEALKLHYQRHINKNAVPNIFPNIMEPMLETASEMAKSKETIPSPHLILQNATQANDRTTPLDKPTIHPEHHPQQIMEMKSKSNSNSTPSMPSVPQVKPSNLIGFSPSAIPQNPDDLLPEKYGKQQQEKDEFPSQNPKDLLLDSSQLQIPPPKFMSKCGSSLSQKSNFECQYCGKECCWCQDMPPGLPLD